MLSKDEAEKLAEILSWHVQQGAVSVTVNPAHVIWLIDRVRGYREALEWYADVSNYDDNWAPRESGQGDIFFGAYDGGDRARAALGKEEDGR